MSKNGVIPISTAMVSVTDPTGLKGFCEGLYLRNHRLRFIATDTAFRLLNEWQLPATVSGTLTGLPSGFLGGLVKTLHPNIHGGILGAGAEFEKELLLNGIPQFDMVIVNFYDFAKAIAQDPTVAGMKKGIDIGGPCMARAAAKNWENVTVVVDPADYNMVLEDVRQHGGVSRDVRYILAAKVFRVTKDLDAAIAAHMWLNAPDRPERVKDSQLEVGRLDPASLASIDAASF